jgi:hypothetical protein
MVARHCKLPFLNTISCLTLLSLIEPKLNRRTLGQNLCQHHSLPPAAVRALPTNALLLDGIRVDNAIKRFTILLQAVRFALQADW